MADRSIILRLQAEISDLKSSLNEVAAAADNVAKSTEKANQRTAQSSVKATAAEKTRATSRKASVDDEVKANTRAEQSAAKAASAAKVRASVRQAAADDEIRANERLRISTEKYGKATATVLQHKDSITSVGRGLGIAGTVAAAGVGLAISKFAEFDKQMSSVAATGADARVNLASLRQASIDAGASTAYSATEAAAGVEALLKAGVSAADVLGGGLAGALNLAASGNLGVADSAEVAATAMTQFNLSGADVPHIADLIAAGAGKAQGEVSDMAAALGQSGLVASQFGLSLEDTIGSLAAFASAGLVGSDAGTSLKTMLLALANPSKESAAKMDELGISAYDAGGKFVGITSLAEQLKSRLAPLSQATRDQALAQIFGNDAVRAANVLYQQGGAGIEAWISQTNEAGYAANQARVKMDNLAGDLEQLKGSFDTALIGAGSGGNKALRELAQDATGAVNAFGKLSPATQQNTVRIAAVAGAALLGTAGLAKLAVGAASTKAALVAMNITASTATARLGAMAVAAGPAIVALLAVSAASVGLSKAGGQGGSQDQVTAQLTALAKGGDDVTASQARLQAAFGKGNWADSLATVLGITTPHVEDLNTALQLTTQKGFAGFIVQAQGLREALIPGQQSTEKMSAGIRAVDDSLAGLVSKGHADQAAAAFQKIAEQNKNIDPEALASQFGAYQAVLRKTAADLDVTTLSNKEYADWMGGKVPEAIKKAAAAHPELAAAIGATLPPIKEQEKSLADVVKAAQAYANAMLQISGSQIGMESAIDAANASLKENGKGLDVNTEKGRANQTALNSLASATLQYTAGLIESGASADKVVAANERGRKSWVDTKVAMGGNREAAEKLSQTLFAIPKDIKSQVVVEGAKVSKKEARELNDALQDIPKESRAEIVTIANTKGAKAAKAAIEAVKDKTVIARSQGDLKGAKAVDGAMKALKDRLVKAVSRGDKRGADLIRNAMAALKSRAVTASVTANTAGVGEVRRALATVNNKVVTVTVVRNTGRGDAAGGLIDGEFGPRYGAASIRRARGGPVWGAGTATSDSIDAKLSAGEFVESEAATSYYGASFMAALNRKEVARESVTALGFAAGGPVASPTNTAAISAMISAIQNPLQLLATATLAAARAASAAAAVNRTLAAPKAALARATARDDDAKADLNALRLSNAKQLADAKERVARAKAAADRGKETKAETRALEQARAAQSRVSTQNAREIAIANARVTATTKAKTAATAAYTAAAEKTKDATDALKEAQEALVAQQKEVADSARQVADTFRGQYESQSTDARDWIELMRTGASDIARFNARIAQLRKAGLSETLVQQIIGMGATAGSEIATQIAGSGAGLVSSLNAASNSLQKQADLLGFKAATGTGRYAGGGLLSGPGTGTSDSLLIRASNGEFMQQEAAVNHYGVGFMHDVNNLNYRPQQQMAPAYGYGQVSAAAAATIDVSALRAAFSGVRVMVENPWTGTYHEARMKRVADQQVGALVGGLEKAHG